MQIAWYIPSKRTYSFEVSLKYEGENEFIKLGKEEDGKSYLIPGVGPSRIFQI